MFYLTVAVVRRVFAFTDKRAWCIFSVIGMKVSKKDLLKVPLYSSYVMLVSKGVCDEVRLWGRVLQRHRNKFLTNFRTP